MKRLVYQSESSQFINAVKEVQLLDGEMQRFLYFSKRVFSKTPSGTNSFVLSKVYWNDDDELVYVKATYRVMLSSGNKVFLTNKFDEGLKFNLKTGTKFWQGLKWKMLDPKIQDILLQELGCEWATESKQTQWGYKDYLYKQLITTNSLANRVLRKRITNPLDLMKAFLSNDPMWRGLKLRTNAPLILKLVKGQNRMQAAYECLKVEENPLRLLQHFASQGKIACELLSFVHQGDLIWELVRLDKKINCNWSAKRLAELHTQCSRDLRELELKFMDSIQYPYSQPCPMLPDMEIIDNNMRLWEEGSIMNHCIYGYLDNAMQRKVFHFHCKFGDGDFSLAVQTYRKWVDEESEYVVDFGIQQMYKAYNTSCSIEQRNAIVEWLAKDEVQGWFANEVKVYEDEVLQKQRSLVQDRMQEAHERIVVPRIVDDIDDLPF
jgi:hypothetical protein